MSIVAGFLLESVEATDTGGNDYADAVAVEIGSILDTGISDSLTGCDDTILCIEVELTEFLAVEMVVGIVVLDLAGKLGFEFGGVEMGDGSGAALAGYGVEPCGLNIVAYGGDGTEAGHHYSF